MAAALPRMLCVAGAALAAALVVGCADKPPQPAPEPACDAPAEVSVRALPGAEDPPVVLWAVGEARLFVDGAPAFSPPEEPKHLAVGSHTLRAEAPGEEPLELRFQVEPFTPAVIHVQRDAGAGLTLVSVGAACRSCEFAGLAPELAPTASRAKVPVLLAGAAAALRKSDWTRAAAFLREVPARERNRPLFLRLVARVYADTRQEEKARAALASIPEKDGNDLERLLGIHADLVRAERARRGEVLLARWNKLAAQFGALISQFQKDAPGPVAAHARRFEGLSEVYAAATRDGQLAGQASAVDGAEATVRALAADIRAARPRDCQLQRDVLGALMR